MVKDIKKGCVLLVDDEEAIRESLGELLTTCGYEVQTADSVDNAILFLRKHNEIEAIISDLKMPGKTGIELLSHLNETGKEIPVIFLTGYGTLETCQEAVRQGAFDYILKPIDDKDKVLFPLKHAVEQSRLQKSNNELKLDIIRMAEEHEALLDSILNDAETKDHVQKKINAIVKKWESR